MNTASAGPASRTWGRALFEASGFAVDAVEGLVFDGPEVDDVAFVDPVVALEGGCARGSGVPPDRSDQATTPMSTTPTTSAGTSQRGRAAVDDGREGVGNVAFVPAAVA